MAGRTQAVYYRAKTGQEPVNHFLEALVASNPRAAAKTDDYIEEYLNDRDTSAPYEKNTDQLPTRDRELAVKRKALRGFQGADEHRPAAPASCRRA